MIRGVVNVAGEATIPLRVIGPSGASDLSAVIDTGYTGLLTLPTELAESLGLSWSSLGTAFLADGSEREFDVYTLEIEWGGVRRTVLGSTVGDEILVGMTFLAGHELRIEVTPGGVVEIRPLP